MTARWGTQRTATPAWRKLRVTILERDNYACRIRTPDICTGAAQTVDHIVNTAAGGTDEPTNLQAACWPCHRRKTGQEAAAAKPQRRRPPTTHPGLL